MADNLIFPIGFDLEKGVRDAQGQMDSVLRRLQKTVDGKPLTIPMSLDPSKFTTFESALRGSIQHITDDAKTLKAALDSSLQTDNSANINRITEAMRNLEAAWKALPNNQKFDINDRLTPKAQEMVRQFNELATASSTYGQTLSQIAGKIKRAADEEAKANQKRNDGYAKLRKTLGAQENSIANLSAKIKAYQQILNSKEIGSKSFERVAEKIRKLTEQLDKAKAKVAELTGKAQSGATRQSAAVKQVSNEFKNQETYVSRLIKRMAVYASFSAFGTFLSKIREVTAQFELQRVSLGAILQDQNKANQLFSEIKAFALKSPVSILDLTKYTKQLAAYKVGYDELFETTKKLTDVSVGLGVSMDRVVLAFGQVRATGYLRASEVRQFTEMGVPIVEELAAKLEKLNGEAVTTAQVMDMISKRGISFEMVKEVFDDMTSAGGIFYNMQEKQGNTLYGLWAKLGDAASVMYSEIGNTGIVNQGMKWLIQSLTDMMKHWRFWGNMLIWAGGLYLVNAGALKLLNLATLRYTATGAKQIAMSKAKVAATLKEIYATRNASTAAKIGARMDLAIAAAKLKAATATNVFSASLYRLWAAFLANPLGWVIGIVGTLIALFYDADDSAKQFAGTLSEIEEKYTLKNLNDADNFKRLADGALKAAAGSKEQRDKLAELDRTYGEIVGSENLQIKKLRAMNGEYSSLIETIKEYNTQMKYSEREGAIKEYYGGKKKEAFGDFEDELSTIGFGSDEVGHEAGATIAINIQDALLEELEKNGKATVDNANKLLKEQLTNVFVARGRSQKEAEQWATVIIGRLSSETEAYVEALNSERNALDANSDAAEKASGKVGVLRKEIEEAKKALDKTNYVHADKSAVDLDSFQYQQMVANATMKKAADLIRNSQEMKDALGDKAKELEPEWLHLVDKVNPDDLMNITTVNFDAILSIIGNKYPDLKRRIKLIQEEWGNVAPTNATALQIRQKLYDLSMSFDPTLQKMKQFLWDGSGTVDEYLKRLKEQQGELNQQLKEMQNTLLQWAFVDWLKDGKTKELIEAEIDEIKNKINVVNELVPYVTEYTVQEDGGGGGGRTKSDPRLQNLKEEISLYEKLYQEYKQYEKAVGSSKAAEYMEREAKDTIDALAKKYGIGLPKNVKDLTAALEILYKKMQALPSKVFKNLDKELKEFRWKIEKVDIDESQKNIEAELKRLADRISRTKTAKEFYEKILEQTGNIDIATRVSMSIYGSTGEELFKDTVKQIREAFKTGSEEHPIDLDISAAIDLENQRIDYKKLADIYEKYQNEIIEKRRDTAKKIAQEGQKEIATDILNWRKSLAKAKSYEQKRTDIINTATAERAKIIRETTDPKERGELLGLSYSKQAQELAKLAVDEFKSSDDYIKVFQDLDRVSTQTLDRMKKRLEEMIATVKDTENVEGLKTLVEQLDKIKEERETRNPIEGIIDSFKEYAKARKDYRTAEAEEAAAKAEFAQQEVGLNQAIRTAKAEQAIAQQRVNDLKAQGKENTSEGVAAELVLNEATKRVTQATENRNKAVKKVNNAEQKTTDALDAQKAALAKLQKNVNAMANAFSSAASSIKTIADMMGIAEDSELGDIVNGLVDGLNNAATIMTTILAIAIAIEAACWWMLAIGAAVAAFSAIGSWLTGSKVRKANKEIERQQELLDQLEYTYGRLEKAADKLFGRDYVDNYNQQLKNLQAQQTAYLKQAQAERSKGKKADKEKIKEYENQARETADKIKELQDDLVAHFTGSTKTDVARQMAQSWIDAKASMSDTFAAIKGDYQDLIKNMIVEGAAARVIENALTPVWNSMQKMLDKNDVEGAIDSLVNGMDSALNAANNGMEVLWKALEARGYDMKSLISDTDSEYSGIAKSVAGATSEEINNVAAIGNTLMYYASPIPRIDENLARVVAIMEGKTAALPTASGGTTGAIDYTDMFATANQHLSSLPRMEQHLAEIHTMLGRALKTKGSTTGFNTFLNS